MTTLALWNKLNKSYNNTLEKKMNKLIKNTIIIIGILLSAIVLILNIFVSSTISNSLEEKVKVVINSPIKLLLSGIVIIVIYFIIDRINKSRISKKRKNNIFSNYVTNICAIASRMDKYKRSKSDK